MYEQQLVIDIVKNIEKVVFGKTAVIYDILMCMIAGGHVLIEDVPGVGKTTLVKTLARSLNLSYSRIQFTPDLLPSDITGISVYNQKYGEFEFKKGPIFANIILADEINRTSPKTQSALLEVMEENQVSEGNNTYRLDKPFMVLATQNPVEYEGTFILPEAQLDRFMMKIRIGYASRESESNILEIHGGSEPLEDVNTVADGGHVLNLQKEARAVYSSKKVSDYVVNIAASTRENKYIKLGASTRASLSLLKIAKAAAFIDGRDYVIPQDVKKNAVSVLSHRICLSPSARTAGYTNETIIEEIVDKTLMPMVV